MRLGEKSRGDLYGSEAYAKQMKEAAEAKAQAELAAKEAATRKAQQAAEERQAKAEAHKQHRMTIKTRRKAAHHADALLTEAVAEFHRMTEAANPQTREAAERRLENARRAEKEARRKVARIQVELEKAQTEQHRAHDVMQQRADDYEELTVRASANIDGAKDVVDRIWQASEAAWYATGTAYRKKNRDRKVKNEAKAILGFATSGTGRVK